MPNMRVLMIEDDVDLAANLGEYLEVKGYEITFAYDGLTGLQRGAEEAWDAVILDLTLPGADGLDICRRLRESKQPEIPILVLTARDSLEDKVLGFEAGADDYVVKPFALAEIDLRLRALHRRAVNCLGKSELRVEDLVMDVALQRVERDGQNIRLSRISFRFLQALMEAAPRVVSKDEIERAIWGECYRDGDRLRSHLYLLRQAVDRPFCSPLIHTVHGRGYRVGSDQDNQ